MGGSSVIGFQILKNFYENNMNMEYTFLSNKIPYKKGHMLDITKKKMVIEKILEINPDIIIHTAALTNVDLCENNNAMADLINVDGTQNLVDAAKLIKCKFVYISTSFVFDGKKKEYSESDETSPSTYYGYTKLRGEEIVKESKLSHLILRIDQPYYWTEKWQHTNSVLRVIQTLRAKKTLKEIIDWKNCPTYIPNFVTALKRLLEEQIEGIFHLVGSDFISRYDWAVEVARIFNLDEKKILPILSSELNLQAKRVNVKLNNKKILRVIDTHMAGVKEGIKEMKIIEKRYKQV